MGQSVNSMASIRVNTCTESKCLSQGLILGMKVEPLLGLFFDGCNNLRCYNALLFEVCYKLNNKLCIWFLCITVLAMIHGL